VIDREFANALTGGLDDWLAALPRYQRDILEEMLDGSDPTDVALAWLSTTGPRDTAPYGGARAGASLFYEKLLEQIQILLCGDEGYEEERAQLLREARAGRSAIVGAIAATVAPAVGAAPVVIAPPIAIILAILVAAGTNALCETLERMIADRHRERGEPAEEQSPPASET
jgi:hypothetical protein